MSGGYELPLRPRQEIDPELSMLKVRAPFPSTSTGVVALNGMIAYLEGETARDAAFLKELSEPGRLHRLGAGEEIIHIDPPRIEEAERIAVSLGVFPPRILAEIPEGWTEGDEACYQYYLRGFYADHRSR